jgi:hypothetical protein
VFGILAGEGKISPDDKIATWILKAHPEFKDALKDKQDIELRHLLSMSSGLYYKQVEGTDPLYYSAPNRLQVALTTVAKVPPGTQFEYTDANPVLVGAAIEAATGEPEDKLAEELGYAHFPPPLPGVSDVLTEFWNGYQAAILGKSDPASALKSSAQKGNQILQQNLKKYGG